MFALKYIVLAAVFVNSCYSNAQDKEHTNVYVDLGLTSHTKWAKFNLDADSMEEYGDSYAWGELTAGGYPDWKDYQYYIPAKKGIDKDGFMTYQEERMIDIGKNISGSKYDVVTTTLGDGWRMPTEEDMAELRKECQWAKVRRGNVGGWKVTGKNGNWIFLPTHRITERNYLADYIHCYWIATAESQTTAYCLYTTDSGNLRIITKPKREGHLIRPIYKQKNKN